ncbi:hypothetical protein AHiyo6_04420 [Arthrobacter sp. Hiyo6]|nr:hypothetical protein AHiyo6_04420 [Arthrobacter sp. Hiyo6]
MLLIRDRGRLFLPFLAILIQQGPNKKVLWAILWQLLGHVPGVIYGILVINKGPEKK